MGRVFPDCPPDPRLAGGIWEKKMGYPILSEFESEFVRKYGLGYGKTCIRPYVPYYKICMKIYYKSTYKHDKRLVNHYFTSSHVILYNFFLDVSLLIL
jgi:hypothetical protein